MNSFKNLIILLLFFLFSCATSIQIICPDGRTVYRVKEKYVYEPYKPLFELYSSSIKSTIKIMDKFLTQNTNKSDIEILNHLKDLLNNYSIQQIVLLKAQITLLNNHPCNKESLIKTENLIASLGSMNFEIETIQKYSEIEDLKKFINNRKKLFENIEKINANNYKINFDNRKKWQLIFDTSKNFKKLFNVQRKLFQLGIRNTRITFQNGKYYLKSKLFTTEQNAIDYFIKIDYQFDNEVYINKVDDEKHKRNISHIYENKSKIKNLLDDFFKKWELESKPLDYKKFSKLNDTIKEAYNLFVDFYKPININKLESSKWRNDLDSLVPYFVIPKEMSIYLTNKNLNDFNENELINMYPQKSDLFIQIDNFRPFFNENKKLLYLDKKKKDFLINFLGKRIIKEGFILEDYKNPNNPIALKRKMNNDKVTFRKFMLKKYISFIEIYGWASSWRLYSRPTLKKIIFNYNMKDAYVTYESQEQGGIAVLKKINNNWIVKYSKIIWME